MTPYEQLRTRISELLPDRLELAYGVEIDDHEMQERIVWLGKTTVSGDFFFIPSLCDCGHDDLRIEDPSKCTILGKPLTIEDVLRALGDVGYANRVDHIGDAYYTDIDFGHDVHYATYALTKPLSAPENEAGCAAVLKLLV